MAPLCKLLCLVLLQVPKCFVPIQIFWASPKIWGLHLVPLLKLLCQHKNQFYWCKSFCLAQNVCDYHNWQYVNKFLVGRKKFGLAQNILWAVKEQGKSSMYTFSTTWSQPYQFFIDEENVIEGHPHFGVDLFCPIDSDDLHTWFRNSISMEEEREGKIISTYSVPFWPLSKKKM